MKKILIAILCLFSLCLVNVNADELPEVTDHEKVTIYIFRGDGCGYCKKALTFFNNLGDTYKDYFVVKTYEVWSDSTNSSFMNAVASELGDTLKGVPYIVVGEYTVNGFDDSIGAKLVEEALKEYQNKEYKDKVSEVKKGYAVNELSLYDACVAEEIIKPERNALVDAIVVMSIFGTIIGGGVALVIFSRKK